MRTIAAFDFDGTLTERDTLLQFLIFVRGKLGLFLDLLACLPTFILCLLNRKSRQATKEKLLSISLRSYTYEECLHLGERFANEKIDYLLRAGVMAKVRKHMELGHEVVIVSANLDLFLIPWGKKWGFTKVICSRLAHQNETVTGDLQGKNCWGDEKAIRLLEWSGPKENYVLWAYGDTRGDKELLELADFAYFRERGKSLFRLISK